MAVSKKSLKKPLEPKVNVSKGREPIKEDAFPEHHMKQNNKCVGISIGTTINMGDYESLRVDVWLTDTVDDNETQQDAYSRIIPIVDKTLNDVVNSYK